MDNHVNTPGAGLPSFSAKEIRSFRHKAEQPLYITMVILNILMFTVGMIICIMAFYGKGPLTETVGDFVKEELLGVSRYVEVHQEPPSRVRVR